MMRIKETIVVEGEYDKIKVLSAVEANVLVTGGFCIFKNKEMQHLIKKLAAKDGIIIMTDSDRAGFLIRNFIKSCTAGETVYHAYIPEIQGKEKRKRQPGKAGLLGVEGMEADVIRSALVNCGAAVLGGEQKEKKALFTKTDLYKAGLYGKENSRMKREAFLKKHDLPTKISSNMLVDVLNLLFHKEDFELF